MKKFRWIAGVILMLALLYKPEAAVNGAREAMAQWYYVVAPSLFPFMVLLPLLMCEEAFHCYEAALGGFMSSIFGLPGASASALIIGMLAGSPAGCIASRRSAAASNMNMGQFERLAAACCGLSPAFLITGIGASMLGNPAYGHVLMRTQVIVQPLMLLLLRFFHGKGEVSIEESEGKDASPIQAAIQSILAVCGYMAFFGALGEVVRETISDSLGNVLLCVMDVSTGARIISNMNVEIAVRLTLLSGLAGFGGLCICVQNLSVLRQTGVNRSRFMASRLMAGMLSAGITALQLRLKWLNTIHIKMEPMYAAAFCICLLLIPVLTRMKKSVFNIEKSAGEDI